MKQIGRTVRRMRVVEEEEEEEAKYQPIITTLNISSGQNINLRLTH